MPTIIKASQGRASVQGVAFNLDDMARHAEQYREKLRQEAAKIIAEAQQQAAAIRQAAEAEGRRAGEQAVEQTVRKQLDQQLQTLLPALRAAVEEIEQARGGWLAHWEQRAVSLAAAIAARVVRRQVAEEPQITLDLLREALQAVAGSSRIRILLHPADMQTLNGQVEQLVAEMSRIGSAELIADSQITRGGCRVETRHGAVDQQFERQLERIEQELR